MTRGAESPGPAGEHDQPLLPAFGTADPGESAFRVAAIKIALDHLLDDRPEKTVRPLEPALILRQEPVEMMEKHPVEDGPLRMSRAIDSRHIENADSRYMPGAPEGRFGSYAGAILPRYSDPTILGKCIFEPGTYQQRPQDGIGGGSFKP